MLSNSPEKNYQENQERNPSYILEIIEYPNNSRCELISALSVTKDKQIVLLPMA